MKYSMTWMAGCAICAFAGMAQADCAADLARFTDTAAMTGDSTGTASGGTEGIAKDGSLAPLEQPAGADTQADAPEASADASSDMPAADMPAADGADSASGEGIAKDGSLAPLEGTEAEPGTAVAMSGSDVQAQQEGEPTAAEEAEGDEAMPDRDSLIANAERALAEGDEAACQEAVDQLEAM
ncbi:hypothetical protein CP157_00297 [Paracoccus marcusii]|uniref:hypothetical protein n=1 Tax=Paracoccus marcusii TaxID=59779 RepID=UPI001C3E87AB|nr:hypothetical protein [Paracoccus marcusii]QXI62623.1 hypothetical protein CP157_00297 [Paracoccus marcusii]